MSETCCKLPSNVHTSICITLKHIASTSHDHSPLKHMQMRPTWADIPELRAPPETPTGRLADSSKGPGPEQRRQPASGQKGGPSMSCANHLFVRFLFCYLGGNYFGGLPIGDLSQSAYKTRSYQGTYYGFMQFALKRCLFVPGCAQSIEPKILPATKPQTTS